MDHRFAYRPLCRYRLVAERISVAPIPIQFIMSWMFGMPVESKGICFDRCVEEGTPQRQRPFEGDLRYMSGKRTVSLSVACSTAGQLWVERTRIPAQSFEHSHRFGKRKIDR